jgi:DNA (cytosine-5)-methyltransferase 1
VASRDLPVVSLFTGAMGLDLGLEKAGFRIAVALECNKYAVDTIRKNRPDLPIINRKIENVTTVELLEAAGLKRGEPFVVSGGPACQVFSTAGQRGSLEDPRGSMFREFVRVVREARPRFFVMENVRGLLSAAVRHRPLNRRGPGHPRLSSDEELGSALRVVVTDLKSLGYHIRFDLLNAAAFGVPQIRHRLVFLGTRDGEILEMPQRTHADTHRKGLSVWRTLRDAIGELIEVRPEYYRFCPSKEKYLKLVPPGGNWRDLPERLRAKALGRAYVSWGGRSGFFRRLDWDAPSPALTTRPDSKATSLCHPTELRPLTVREYARLQQFDDDWVFCGPVRQQYKQVGNAVPVGLGMAIGLALRATMRKRNLRGRRGSVECQNVDLLVKMAQRPTTILNPPRMREKTGAAVTARWLGKRERNRKDVVGYAAPEIREEVKDLLASGGRMRRNKSPRKQGHNTTEVEIRIPAVK